MSRFFVDKASIKDGRIDLGTENSNHIVNVLRARAGDEITVCDGDLNDYICILTDVNKKHAVGKIIEKVKNTNEPPIHITLFQGIPKGDKMDTVIQKCVEIGVDRIVPVKTEYTVVKTENKEEKKTTRWNRIAEAAAKQCGRGKIPVVESIITFKEAAERVADFRNAVIPYEMEKERGIREFIKTFKGNDVAVYIGPEGGFSKEEIALAISNNITPVTLGKRILRTETAGLVTSVILLYELEGRM